MCTHRQHMRELQSKEIYWYGLNETIFFFIISVCLRHRADGYQAAETAAFYRILFAPKLNSNWSRYSRAFSFNGIVKNISYIFSLAVVATCTATMELKQHLSSHLPASYVALFEAFEYLRLFANRLALLFIYPHCFFLSIALFVRSLYFFYYLWARFLWSPTLNFGCQRVYERSDIYWLVFMLNAGRRLTKVKLNNGCF